MPKHIERWYAGRLVTDPDHSSPQSIIPTIPEPLFAIDPNTDLDPALHLPLWRRNPTRRRGHFPEAEALLISTTGPETYASFGM